jgi:diacylglycerol kinase (ATP)
LENKKKILFIINPISGIGKQKNIESVILRKLDLLKFDYSIKYTQYPHHAIEIAKEAAEKGIDIVVAVGGDGSINDVASGILKSNTAMAIIPAGSGNGLANYLNIPLNISKAIKIINSYKILEIDTATLNGNSFISIAGMGFDAVIAEKFALTKLRGFWAYLKITIREFFKYSPQEFTISFDNKQIKRTALLVSFANSNQFGFNISIAPKASVTDGYIDLCVISKMSALKLALISPKLFLKNIQKSKKVEI